MPGPIAQAALLAAPDHHISPMTLTELADHVRRMCRASTISLIVGTQAIGNAIDAMRTVEELESAGVSCLLFDDLVKPIPFAGEIKGWSGHQTSVEHQLIPLEEALGRIKAAVTARQDPSLVIGVRCSGLPSGGPLEAIRRVKAYEKAGRRRSCWTR